MRCLFLDVNEQEIDLDGYKTNPLWLIQQNTSNLNFKL